MCRGHLCWPGSPQCARLRSASPQNGCSLPETYTKDAMSPQSCRRQHTHTMTAWGLLTLVLKTDGGKSNFRLHCVCACKKHILTSSSSPWTRRKCFSSGGPGCAWSAGWSRSRCRCCKHRRRGVTCHTAWALTPRPPCAARCPSAAPGQ